MKHFVNLAEAIGYHSQCYLCNTHLVCYSHGTIICPKRVQQKENPIQGCQEWRGPDLNQEQSVEFNFSSNVDTEIDDIFTVNIINNEVNYAPRRRDSQIGYGQYGIKRFNPSYFGGIKPYSGFIHESIYLECPKCARFNYIIQIIIDINENAKRYRLADILLNSEHISVVDGDDMYCITNSYPPEVTEVRHRQGYHKFNWNESSKITDHQPISLPLIPLNPQDPMQTVARIKKLLPFS